MQIAKKQAALDSLVAQVNALKALQPEWVRYSDLAGNTLPALRDKVVGLERQLSAKSAEADEAREVRDLLEVRFAFACKTAVVSFLLHVVFVWLVQYVGMAAVKRMTHGKCGTWWR